MDLTVDQALKQIHREYEGDINYPDFNDDETQLRVGYLKDSIREWGDRFPKFRELFALLSDAPDGTKQTSAGVTKYSCPTNFIRPSTWVKIGDKRLSYVPPEDMEKKLAANVSDEWFSVIGSPSKYKIVINPAPSGTSTIEYPYWRIPTQPALTTDILEISRPLFCIYYVLSKLFRDDDPDRAKEFENKMDDQERKERVALVQTPGQSNRVNTPGYGFGQKAPNE